jgi:asparagine synthase (glutamine-hydrolysing)
MSGIVGLYSYDGGPAAEPLLARMTDAMAFRGPDARRTWAHGPVGLGHTLLKTTWESERERQPCKLPHVLDDVWIVADARIDGRDELAHELVDLPDTASRVNASNAVDCELILHAYHAWGEDCVSHLVGDFAFAIWDSRVRRLFCARDHFGVKPFYYAQDRNTFAFSNTLNCLRLHPAVSDELNELAVADFLLFELNQDLGTTTFADVRRLPPAHTLTVSEMGVRLRRYWKLRTNEHMFRRSIEYVERFEELFLASVRDRVRTCRVAALMSGGLDSPSIVATAKRVARESATPLTIHAHTMVYDRLMPDRERHYSGLVADYLGIPIHYLPVDDYRFFDRWDRPDLPRPEPTSGALELMERDFFARAASTARVAFSGDGGDAVQCPPQGYLAALLKRGRLGTVARSALHLWRSTGRIPRLGIRFTIGQMLGTWKRECVPYPEWLNPDFEHEYQLRERWQSSHARNAQSEIHPRGEARAFLEQPYWTFWFEMQEPGATREALEIRYPFFDIRLLDFMLGIPPIPWYVEKNILRVAMTGQLPHEVRVRPKTPLVSDGYSERKTQIATTPHAPGRELERFVDVQKLAKAELAPGALGQALGALSLDWWLRHFRAFPTLQRGTS